MQRLQQTRFNVSALPVAWRSDHRPLTGPDIQLPAAVYQVSIACGVVERPADSRGNRLTEHKRRFRATETTYCRQLATWRDEDAYKGSVCLTNLLANGFRHDPSAEIRSQNAIMQLYKFFSPRPLVLQGYETSNFPPVLYMSDSDYNSRITASDRVISRASIIACRK